VVVFFHLVFGRGVSKASSDSRQHTDGARVYVSGALWPVGPTDIVSFGTLSSPKTIDSKASVLSPNSAMSSQSRAAVSNSDKRDCAKRRLRQPCRDIYQCRLASSLPLPAKHTGAEGLPRGLVKRGTSAIDPEAAETNSFNGLRHAPPLNQQYSGSHSRTCDEIAPNGAGVSFGRQEPLTSSHCCKKSPPSRRAGGCHGQKSPRLLSITSK
jgi:hypothetical protein